MARVWFDTSKRVPDDMEVVFDEPCELEEVDLGQFASILGMTRDQYVACMMSLLESCRLPELLNFESRSELEGWILESGRYDDLKPFCVMFRLSLNRVRDSALYCQCRMDMSGDEPVVMVDNTVPGLTGMVPDSMSELQRFEAQFADYATNIEMEKKA